MRSPRPKRGLPGGLILSLLLHSLPLLTLIGWRPIAVEIPRPIPIQLVIEQPPAPPEPSAVPPPMRGASADLAETIAPKPEQVAAETPSPPETPAPPAEPPAPAKPQNAAAAPPPPATEPALSEEPAPIAAEPRPAETRTAALAPPPPPPKPARRHQETPIMSMPMASAWPLPLHRDQPREVQHFATLTGPAAIRDEYCVRALNLTLRHLDLLPLSSLGGRRGRAVLTIRILGDGTINSVRLTQSSGFSDIDQRIQRMVFAVGQYPPLPPRMPGTWTDFTFVMVFPDALQR